MAKQHDRKKCTKPDEVGPRGASFNTPEGRAAQGMDPEIGSESDAPLPTEQEARDRDRKNKVDEKKGDAGREVDH